MNWTFWTQTPPINPDDCGTIDPLLSLYADRMASAEEARRVETHLPGCAACRESLAWMRATQYALASRPVVAPPADLRTRIAAAIAASSDTPVPVSFSMRRSFALRPAFAAAASLAVLGIVSYSLLHHPQSAAVQPVKPPLVAAVPSVPLSPPVVRTMPGPSVKLRLMPHPAPAAKHTSLAPALIARSQPDEAAPAPIVVKPHPQAKPDKMLAEVAPVLASFKPRPLVVKKPILRASQPEMMATNKGFAPSAAPHRPSVVKPEPKIDIVVAEAPHAQMPSVPALIEKQPVVTQDPAPTVTVASKGEGRLQTAEDHGRIRIHFASVFTHATIARLDSGIANSTHHVGSDGMAYIPGVYSPSK